MMLKQRMLEQWNRRIPLQMTSCVLLIGAVLLSTAASYAEDCPFPLFSPNMRSEVFEQLKSEGMSLSQTCLGRYRQVEPLAWDPVGDFVLARSAQRVVGDTREMFFREKTLLDAYGAVPPEFAPSPEEYVSEGETYGFMRIPITQEYIHSLSISSKRKEALLRELNDKGKISRKSTEGRLDPIDSDAFAEMMKEVMREESGRVQVTIGTPHEWSPSFLSAFGDSFQHYVKFSKVLVALSGGVTSWLMKTGKEDGLSAYLLVGNADSSLISPEQLFRKSLILNQGDVYSTILTIENVLSRNWLAPRRNQLKIVSHLMPIGNYLGNRGDHYGLWYHFFGTMLYGYYAGLKNSLVSVGVEAIASKYLFSGVKRQEAQEASVGYSGGSIGSKIRKSMDDRSFLRERKDPSRLEKSRYLRLTEFEPASAR